MTPDSGNGTTLTYRVSQLEKEFDKLEGKLDKQNTTMNEIKQEVAVLRTEFKAFEINVLDRLKDIEGTFNDDVKGLRKVAIGAGSAVLIAAITFAISALKVFGGPG